jgi:hypothetical protein
MSKITKRDVQVLGVVEHIKGLKVKVRREINKNPHPAYWGPMGAKEALLWKRLRAPVVIHDHRI